MISSTGVPTLDMCVRKQANDFISYGYWDHCPQHELHQVYISLVRSVLEYASPAYVGLNKKLAGILCKIDKRTHKIMFCWPSSCDSLPVCKCTAETLTRCRLDAAERLFKCIDGHESHLLFTCVPYRLPCSRHFRLPRNLSDKCFHLFFPFMIRNLNNKL